MKKTFRVNEIFLSAQGEGVRAGTINVFVRFSGCNLTCKLETDGFDCDTEFASGVNMTADEIAWRCKELAGDCKWIVLTGGEPMLQVDDQLIALLHENGFLLAIESNGSQFIQPSIDWICVSPKQAEHTLRANRTGDIVWPAWKANELKYVRNVGQGIPKPSLKADHYLISPAFENGVLKKETLEWCIKLCKDNPQWRLSLQLHKFLGVR